MGPPPAPQELVSKGLRPFETKGNVQKKSVNSAEFTDFFLPFCCAHAPKGRTLAKQKVIFPTYMPSEKYLILGFLTVCKFGAFAGFILSPTSGTRT